jgi:hypothetical protein
LKKLHIDGGGEFLSKEFKKSLLDNSIQLEITAPYSPSQNGIAKCLNRPLVEHTCAMIHQNGLPYLLWMKAVAYATYLKHRLPTCTIKDHKVPDEVFWGKKLCVTGIWKNVLGLTAGWESLKAQSEIMQVYFCGDS